MIPRKALTGERFAAGSYNTAGKYVEGTGSAIAFTASVQPLNGDELEALPEGRREKETYKLYTDFALRTIDENGKLNPDHVSIGSGTFEVISVQDWQNTLINHYKAIVSRINDD